MQVGLGGGAVAVADLGVVAVGDGSRPCCRGRFGGCGNSRLRGVVGFGVMAIGAERQLGVLLGTLRFWGLWQADSCHNPDLRNAKGTEIATTPFSTTGAGGGTGGCGPGPGVTEGKGHGEGESPVCETGWGGRHGGRRHGVRRGGVALPGSSTTGRLDGAAERSERPTQRRAARGGSALWERPPGVSGGGNCSPSPI